MTKRGLKNTGMAVATSLGLALTLAVAVPARAAGRQSKEFHQTYSLSSSGQVSLENVNGSVHIMGWDQNQVKVDAVETVWAGTSLGDVKIEVDSQPGFIRIETKTPRHWPGGSHWRVDYTVMVPKHARLDKVDLVNGGAEIEGIAGAVNVSSVNGPITTRDLSGVMELSAVNGPIKASLAGSGVPQPVSLKTVNGPISLTLPPGTNANLSARTLNGRISCDFPIKINAGYVGRTLEGVLGKGGASINLRTVNGAISIHRGAPEAN